MAPKKPPKPKSAFIARLPLYVLLSIERATERLIAETVIDLSTCKKPQLAKLTRTLEGATIALAVVRGELERRAMQEAA